MTAVSDPPAGAFRLSMLLNDTRYRSYTFQFAALLFLIAVMAFLGVNLLRNLAAAGLDFSFDFLGSPSGYDINQTPIEYDSQSTHLRAAMVGILNTLIVAALGCVTATVLGVFAGVLRLSKNWLVAKIMAVYVEAFRNVPVLIWILIVFSIMTISLPAPSAFRGEDPTASLLFGSFAFTNRGIYTPLPLWTIGTKWVVFTFLASMAAIYLYRKFVLHALLRNGAVYPFVGPALFIAVVPTLLVLLVPSNDAGVLLGTFFRTMVFVALVGGAAALLAYALPRISRQFGPLALAASLAVLVLVAWAVDLFAIVGGLWAFTGVSGLSTFWDFELPALKGFNFQGGIQIRGSLIALWFALAFYTGAFIAENVRAGIQAVSRGQTEAAAALGLRPNRIMNLVILPQALRVIIPPLVSQYLNLTKNSSLAIAVGYMDVTGTLGGITLNQTGRAIECVLLLMLFYLVISLAISAFMNLYNNSVKLRER